MPLPPSPSSRVESRHIASCTHLSLHACAAARAHATHKRACVIVRPVFLCIALLSCSLARRKQHRIGQLVVVCDSALLVAPNTHLWGNFFSLLLNTVGTLFCQTFLLSRFFLTRFTETDRVRYADFSRARPIPSCHHPPRLVVAFFSLAPRSALHRSARGGGQFATAPRS